MAIFRKLLGRELKYSLITEIYLHCQVEFTGNAVGTEAPDLVYLGIPDVNALDEFNASGNSATRVRRPTNGSHWSVPDHVFGEARAVVMSYTRSKQNYSYKTGFEIRRKIGTLGAKKIQ